MGKYEATFVETQALEAALNDDDDELERLLYAMLPGELVTLANAAEHLAAEARSALRELADAKLAE